MAMLWGYQGMGGGMGGRGGGEQVWWAGDGGSEAQQQ